MHINLVGIILIVVIAGLAWWVNAKLNPVPVLKTVIDVLIVVISVLMLLQSAGIMGGSSSISIS